MDKIHVSGLESVSITMSALGFRELKDRGSTRRLVDYIWSRLALECDRENGFRDIGAVILYKDYLYCSIFACSEVDSEFSFELSFGKYGLKDAVRLFWEITAGAKECVFHKPWEQLESEINGALEPRR